MGEINVAKVAGEDNPADLLTKHVNAATLHKHIWKLGFGILQDRAATAPTLNALLGLLNSVPVSKRPEGLNGEYEAKILDRQADSEIGVRQQDAWSQEGVFVMRQHVRSRRELFTPLHVSGSPEAKMLCPTRITEGTFEDGQAFRTVDAWRSSKAHTRLEQHWTGHTMFILRHETWI